VSGVLLDTNVISEIAKPQPEPNVIAFLDSLTNAFVSALTIHELEFGISRLPQGKRRATLAHTIAEFLELYGDHILPIDRQAALSAARLRRQAEQTGATLHLADALIAGTALAHNLAIATRNVSDFEALGVPLVNPWTGA